jgi:hypothetical protein
LIDPKPVPHTLSAFGAPARACSLLDSRLRQTGLPPSIMKALSILRLIQDTRNSFLETTMEDADQLE